MLIFFKNRFHLVSERDAWYASHLSDLALQWLVDNRVIKPEQRGDAAALVREGWPCTPHKVIGLMHQGKQISASALLLRQPTVATPDRARYRTDCSCPEYKRTSNYAGGINCEHSTVSGIKIGTSTLSRKLVSGSSSLHTR